jgi:6-pyruvoyltetrahydropterin/6-carboxytetrahydropterin synthase
MVGRISEEDRSIDRLDDAERVLHIGRDRPIRISAGHRLIDHEGKCSRPHGHNYEITVAVRGSLTDSGWVVDKGEVTDVIDEWDHRFLLEQGDPLIDAFERAGDEEGIIVLAYPPTAEVMSAVLEQRLNETLPETVSDVAVEIRETSELCAGREITTDVDRETNKKTSTNGGTYSNAG